jgi:transcription initiation factor TFIIB
MSAVVLSTGRQGYPPRNRSVRSSSSSSSLGGVNSGSNGISGVSKTVRMKRMWTEFKEEDAAPLETKQLPTNDLCNKCNSVNVMGEDGLLVCNSCGLTNSSILDYSPEWRFYSSDDRHATDPSRCGNPIDPLLEQSSYAGKVLCGGASSSEMKNMGRWIGWQGMPPHEKALYEEFQIISTLAHNGGLSKLVIDSAKQIYKEFYDRQTCRGQNRDATRVGAVWLACWKHGCPRSANELSVIFKVDRNTASAGCTGAEEMLKTAEQSKPDMDKSQFAKITPSAFVERFCSKLSFPEELVRLAMYIADRVERLNLITDNRPTAVAVGIVYFISYHCNFGHNKLAIKQALDSEVSEVTMGKCFNKLNAHLDKLMPSQLISKYATNQPVAEKRGRKLKSIPPLPPSISAC